MTNNVTPKAVILLSGGIDSSTVLAIAKNRDNCDCYAMSFEYGQRHIIELDCAVNIAKTIGVRDHIIMKFDLRSIGGSALTSSIDVPKERTSKDISQGIPVTYVPARNTIFLSFALAWAEVLGAESIYIGVNALDYSGYPDCRQEYVNAYETMANLATKSGVEGTQRIKIKTPLIAMTKAEIIATGVELGIDYALTNSCYDPNPEGACGKCDSCQLRLKGFTMAGFQDPIKYRL